MADDRLKQRLAVARRLAADIESGWYVNLGVGMPIDLVTVRRDEIRHEVLHRIEAGEPYFHDLRERWSAALRAAHKAIPPPPYK